MERTPVTMIVLNELLKTLKEELEDLNRSNLADKSKEVTRVFNNRFKFYLDNKIRDTYVKSKYSILRQHKITPYLTSTDNLIIEEFANSDLLWQSYANMNEALSRKINSILASNFNKDVFNPWEARRELLKDIPKLTKSRASMILRTENNNIRSIATENTYRTINPENDWKYIMFGPTDSRNAPSTIEVKRRQGNGMSLDDLKDLIRDVAMEYNPKSYSPSRPWQIHIQSRQVLHKV